MKTPFRSLLAVGDLVEVNRLTSRRGKELNGKFGIIRSPQNAAGRLAVEIFAFINPSTRQSAVADLSPPVSLKRTNLDAIDTQNGDWEGCRYLEVYLLAKAMHFHNMEGPTERVYRIFVELYSLPRFVPEPGLTSIMVGLLRVVGKYDEAISMAKGRLSELLPGSQERSVVVYDLVRCLAHAGHLEEALDMVVGIEIVAGNRVDHELTKTVKIEMLQLILRKSASDEEGMHLKTRVLKVGMQIDPKHPFVVSPPGSA